MQLSYKVIRDIKNRSGKASFLLPKGSEVVSREKI